MFWTIVGAILFVTVGIPVAIYVIGFIIALISILLRKDKK